MDQIKELQDQIETLKKVVSELQNGTVRVETNVAKLCRMKKEIIAEVLPEKVIREADNLQISHFNSNITIVTNDLFFMKTGVKTSMNEKMGNYLFKVGNEKLLNEYLSIYRSVCEFMANQYAGNWKSKYSEYGCKKLLNGV